MLVGIIPSPFLGLNIKPYLKHVESTNPDMVVYTASKNPVFGLESNVANHPGIYGCPS